MDTEFLWENLRDRNDLRDQGVDRRIILKWIFSKKDGSGLDKLMWRDVVNPVTKRRGNIKCSELVYCGIISFSRISL